MVRKSFIFIIIYLIYFLSLPYTVFSPTRSVPRLPGGHRIIA